MRRDQLEHAIRTACQIVGHPEVIIVGSQAILGSLDEADLPPVATMSMEIDVLPIASTNEETARLADQLEGVAGELSPFEAAHGFSIDGVDLTTSALPDGWRDRLVKVSNANTAGLGGEPVFTGWCLDKEDICVAKLCALREKDREFVRAGRCSARRSGSHHRQAFNGAGELRRRSGGRDALARFALRSMLDVGQHNSFVRAARRRLLTGTTAEHWHRSAGSLEGVVEPGFVVS
jgi:hypothetical protein